MYKVLNNNIYVENINNKKNKVPKFGIKANNNDSFQFLLMIFIYFELFFHSIYTFFISFLMIVANVIYKIKISFGLILFLLRILVVCEDNSKIPSDLIISSYFPTKNFVRITYEMIQNKEMKEKLNEKDKDKEYDCDDLNECNDYLNNIQDNDCMFEKDIKLINKKKMVINEKKIDDFIDNKKARSNANNNEIFFDNNTIKIQNILINIFSFLLVFFFIKLTFKKKKSFFLLYSLFLVISYKLMKYLYQNEYYLASNLIYILFMYSNKKVIDSIYLLLKFKRKDFEIFSTDLSAINSRQLFLKLIILFYLTFLSAIFSILLFTSWLNYIIYFLCILNILSFLGNIFDQIAYYGVKPIKNIIIFIAGIINLLLSKLFLKYYIFSKGNNEMYINKNNLKDNIVYMNLDSFYLIYDLFSVYCLNYIKGYLEYQIKILPININYNYTISHSLIYRHYLKLNYILLLLLFLSAFIAYLGILKNEFICIFISLYMIKISSNYLQNLYHYKICIIINYFIVVYFLAYVPKFSTIKDFYITNIFLSLPHVNNDIYLSFIKFIFLISLFNYIFKANYLQYIDLKKLEFKEKKNNIYLNVNISDINFFFIEEIIHFFIICLICIIYKYYEMNLIIKLIYIILVIIFHLLKIPSIRQHKVVSNNNELINSYHFYIFIWIIISLRLIILSGQNFTLLQLINHFHLIVIIICCVLNEDIYFKILIIIALCISYYRLNSFFFIIDIYNILILTIIKINNKKESNNSKNILENKRFKFIIILFLPIFSFIIIKIIFLYKSMRSRSEKINDYLDIFFNNNDINKKLDINEGIEFFIISKLIYNKI